MTGAGLPAEPPQQGGGPLARAARIVAAIWSGLRQVFFGVLPAMGIAALLFMLAREVRKHDIELAPIPVPAKLADAGLTPEVMASRLLDQLDAGVRIVVADTVGRPLAELSGSQPDFNVPIAGLSLRSTANLLRNVLGIPQRRISGEIVLEPGDRIGMRLRMSGEGQIADLHGFAQADPDAMLRAGALEIWRVIEPGIYVWQIYLRGGDQTVLRQRLDVIEAKPDLDANARRTIAYARSRSLAVSNRAEEALEIADALVAANRNWPLAWHARGIALQRLDRTDDAAAALREGMAAPGRSTWCHQALAVLLRDRGDFAGSLDVVAQAKRIRLDDPGIWIEETYTLAQMNRGSQAIMSARQAIVLAPRSASSQAAMARALIADRQYQPALEAAELATQLGGGQANAWYQKAEILRLTGEFAPALSAYQEAQRVDSGSPWSYVGAGWTYRRMGQHAAALEAFEAAIQRREAFGQAHGGRGLALVSLGRGAEARAALERAVALGYRPQDITAALARLP